jgi:sterol desaturase/sphingolipid hydroxylase (fatty acid hydroxylase superfamily)
MVRGVLGVVAGAVLWMLGCFVLVLLLAQLWPDYAIHGRQWTRENLFTFTPLMACCNLVFWMLAEVAAGWAAAKIAKRREAVWGLSGLVPWWYNLGVVIPAVPAVLFGGKLAQSHCSEKAALTSAT